MNFHNTKILKEIFEECWQEVFLYDSFNDEKITYSQFFDKILDFKDNMLANGIKKNDFLCVF